MLYQSLLDDLLTGQIGILNGMLSCNFNSVLDFIALTNSSRI